MSQIQLYRIIGADWPIYRLNLLLLIACLASAMAVVHFAHLNRLLTTQQDTFYQQRDQLDIEWRNLLLEQRSLSEHSRVEDIARNKLNMQRPTGKKDIVVAVP